MDAGRWVAARAVRALGWVALVVLVAMPFGGCSSGSEPAPASDPPVKDACSGECRPGEWLREDGCCQPAGLPLDMACPPGEWPRENGECQPAGLPLDMPCPPGEWVRGDGGCQPAGVPPEDCGDGFAPDGNGGCNVILPVEDCPKGQMAIPGETVCHEVAPCGSGDYGDIPVDPATTQFVNLAYLGTDSDGSEAKPWKTIQQGIDAAEPGAIVAVAVGSYAEDVIIEGKPVVLWGRCPALVEVAGTGENLAAVQVLDGGASASEIRGLAITGHAIGLFVTGASEIVVDRMWIHDTTDRGLGIQNSYGPTSVAVTASIIEVTGDTGVFVGGSGAVLSGVTVRDILPDGAGDFGWGIVVQYDPPMNERAKVQVIASVVERTHEVGVFIYGSDVELQGVVVRDILPGEAGSFGWGILSKNDPEANERANVQVTSSVVERTHGAGALILGSDVELQGVVVRDILPDEAGSFGWGILSQNDPEANERANVQVTASVIERTRTAGVFVENSDVELLGVVVRDILPDGAGYRGRGIQVQSNPQTNERANVQVTASVVERTQDAGVFVLNADAALAGIVVRDIQPNGAGEFGFGIGALTNVERTERSNVRVTASVVERVKRGVFVEGSDATLSGIVVRDSQPGGAVSFGGGIVIQDNRETNERANVQVTASVIEQIHDVGMSVAGSDAVISGVVVRKIMPDGAGEFGWGISIHNDQETNNRANVQMTASVIERANNIGVFVGGSDARIMAVVVRHIYDDSVGPVSGSITIQNDPETYERANVQVKASLVEGSRYLGVNVTGSTLTIEGSIVRGTSGSPYDTFGDGIVVSWDGVGTPAEATITGTIVESNARAGLASWGATVRFSGTVLSCNAFDLQGEVFNDRPFAFPDSHDNLCGCPAVADTCNALSTGLSPPPPLEDLPIPDPPSGN